MTKKRFTTVELSKPNRWGIWYDGAYLSTYQVCILLNEYVDVKKENEQLKKDLKSYQSMVKEYINLHIDKIRRRYVNPTREEVAERTRIIRDLEQLKKELQ